MSRKRVIVVGAGPAGLAAAWELTAKGMDVVVLESDPQYVGGLAKTLQWHGLRFDIGGHRFFSKNPAITRWWQDRLGQDFIQVKRLSRIIYNGRFFDYPLKPWDALNRLGIWTSMACMLSFLRRQMCPLRPEYSFEDWVTNRFGDKLYHIFFKTYTEKVWGIPCSAINADWASQRIQGLSLAGAVWKAFGGVGKAKTLIEEFDYPRQGAGMMWEKTRDEILARGGQIMMGRMVNRFERDQNRVIAAWTVSQEGKTERYEGDEFIVSMPLKDCIRILDDPIANPARTAAEHLGYRAFILVLLVINRPNLFPDNWIYVHSPEVKVGRLQNFNNWSGDMVGRPEVTSLALEYFCNEGDDLWQMSDSGLIALGRREIEQLGLANSNEILEGCVAREAKAYPVYDANYRQHVQSIREALKQLVNFQVVGRNGMHKYNNQDHSMLTGQLAAQNVIDATGKRHDVWRVNTNAEYLEAGTRDADRTQVAAHT